MSLLTHLFIINPAAGSRDRTDYYTEKVQKACGSRGFKYRIEVSAAPGDCTRITREAAESGEEYRIYACGGDGTLNEVAAGAAAPLPHPLGEVPQCAHWGGEGPLSQKSKIFDSSPIGRAKTALPQQSDKLKFEHESAKERSI